MKDKGIRKNRIVLIIVLQILVCAFIFASSFFMRYGTEEASCTESVNGNVTSLRFNKAFEPGSYDIIIDYEAKDDKTTYCFKGDSAFDFTTVDAWFHSSVKGYFSEYSDVADLQILLNFGSSDLTLDITENGENFKIKDIRIRKNPQMIIINALRLLFLFICLDILYLAIRYLRKKKVSRILTAGFILLLFVSCLPLLLHGLNDTYDATTHMLRIEGMKEAWLSGQFPARIQPIQVDGYGYASSILYPELFLSIPAFLRICAVPVVASFKIFLVLMNIFTILIAYSSFLGIFKEDWAAFCGTVMYTLAPYRVGDVYYRQSVGEYLSYLAFPLIALGIYRLLKERDKRSWIVLAAGFTIVLQSHILSIIYVAAGCLAAALIFRKEFFKKDTIFTVVKSILFTCALNLWFIIPFCQFFGYEYNTFGEFIQSRGLSVTQLFVVFLYPKINNPFISGTIPYGIGMASMFSLALFVLYFKKGQPYSKTALWSVILGAILALMSTRYFPWDRLAHFGGAIQKIIFNIQFPARMCEPMTICLCVAGVAGLIWAERHHGDNGTVKFVLVLSVCVLSFIHSAAMTDNVIQRNDLVYQSLSEMDTTLVGAVDEYYPIGVTRKTLDARKSHIVRSSDKIEISDYMKKGSNMSLNVENKSGKEGYIDLPMVAYDGMESNELSTKKAEDGVIRLTVPKDYSGSVSVGYKESPLFLIADLVSLICVIGFMISEAYRRKKTAGNKAASGEQ